MNDPIRSVGVVRQGVERGRGADAAAQQRFLAMLAAVRQIETGSEGPDRPHAAGAADANGADTRQARRGRASHHVGALSLVTDADPSLFPARDPVLRDRDATTTPPSAVMSVRGAMLDRSGARPEPRSIAPRAVVGPAQSSQDGARAPATPSPHEVAPGRSDASAHRVATPIQPTAHGATTAAPTAAPPVATQQMGVASSPPAVIMPSGRPSTATGSSMAASRSDGTDAGMWNAGARGGGVGIARAEVAMAGMRSGSDARAHQDLPPDATRVQADVPPMVLNRDPRQFRHGRTTDRSLAEVPGRSAEPADSELGAMLRHLMGAGGAHRAQRLVDGSWVTRVAIPGEGAVSIRIARTPEQISVRLSGDPELVRRVRETLEAGASRDGRRLSIQDIAEA